MLHRSTFITGYVPQADLPVVESIGFTTAELPHTPVRKDTVVSAHESRLPQAPKKAEPKYSTKYIVVFMSRHILGAIENQKYVHTFYDINLPADVKNPKIKKGDGLVPLGDYYILRHELSNGRMFLFLNYPNIKDAERGLKAGIITQNDYNRIAAAQKKGVLPPFDTGLGGPLLIRGDGVKGKNTAGNIAITPAQMQQIWSFAPKGTPVRIVP